MASPAKTEVQSLNALLLVRTIDWRFSYRCAMTWKRRLACAVSSDKYPTSSQNVELNIL